MFIHCEVHQNVIKLKTFHKFFILGGIKDETTHEGEKHLKS